MTPFYFIDGPLKGQILESDFRPTYTSTDVIYYKHTFAMKVNDSILYIDVASIDPYLQQIEVAEDMPFHIRTDSLILNKLQVDGRPHDPLNTDI